VYGDKLFKNSVMQANFLALAAIALWASLAVLGLSLKHIPPFLLTGIALVIGSIPAWPFFRQWKVTKGALALGIYGLFGFHFLLFIALRHAPPVEANLINYLWPLGIVVMAPLFLPGTTLSATHIVAAAAGFTGACIAILGDSVLKNGLQGITNAGFAWGYIPAAGSAFIWASYSLMSKRLASTGRGFPTAAIGLFGLVSGLLSLLCHVLMEPAATLSGQDWALMAAMGLGPLGAAFFLWDAALKKGDARQIGILSYITPLASTALLIVVTGRALTWSIGLATALIIGAAVLGARAK
jgi:drug/metabolite transporter (DMT)-like permease